MNIYRNPFDEILNKNQDVLTDLEAALLFGHREDDNTEILSTLIDGESYTLQCSGHLQIIDAHGEIILNSAKDSYTRENFKLISKTQLEDNNLELVASPWFEWVDESGMPVGDVFDSISIDLEQEVNDLKTMLRPNTPPMPPP